MSVFISGASSGIGAACARAFGAAGKELVLVARRKDRVQALARDVAKAHGVQVHAFQLDVRDRKAVESFIEEHAGLLSAVEVLVNNAGLAAGLSAIQAGNVDEWERMIDTNLKGLLYVSRGLLPKLIEKSARGGNCHVVNIGSVAGRWTYPNGNVYCATKFGVRALSESMRLDLHGTGIRVTEIAPGMAETEFSEVRLGDKEKAKAVYAGMRPLSAEDVAETVLWCVGRPKHVNIQELVVFPTDQSSVTLVKRAEAKA
ncbi:MAG: NAD(P)-dependent oxidoreductase [Bdellovibrionales bacterium GWB1_55_8]|nr:MAG: NAD(P)-dependent oxidoreductase [Bdellovibrionales bacterium GWB1_55_8]